MEQDVNWGGAGSPPKNQSLENESGGAPAMGILLLILGLSVFFILSVVGTYYFFISYRDTLTREQIQTAFVQELRDYRAMEAEELSTYGVLDAERGTIRLPIEQGIEKTLQRYKR